MCLEAANSGGKMHSKLDAIPQKTLSKHDRVSNKYTNPFSALQRILSWLLGLVLWPTPDPPLNLHGIA